MSKKFKPVKPVEKDKQGNITFNLDSDAANADWLRAARLLIQGKKKEVDKLFKTKMYYLEDDDK